METIVARLRPFGEATYDSPDAAIRGAKLTHEKRVALNDPTAAVGKQIASFAWQGTSVSFELLPSGTLSLFCADGTVQWQYSEAPARRSLNPEEGSSSPVKLLVRSEEWIWDRDGLLRRLVGKQVLRLFAGSTMVWFYASDSPILRFCVLERAPEWQPFLYWCETT